MRFEATFEAEPFEGYTEFDEMEFEAQEFDALEASEPELSEAKAVKDWMSELSRNSSDYVSWIQQSLNRISGLRLTVDGIIGPQTRSAIRSFQQRVGLKVDGIVGAQTEAALIAAGAGKPPDAGEHVSGASNANGQSLTGGDFTPEGLVPVPGINKTSRAFREKVINLARSLGTDPNFLMAAMSFESGLDPAARNRWSNATGLIQFMPSTARTLGTSIEALAGMTAEQQLDYVAKYFAPYKGRLKTLEDVYMAVLWPAAIGKGRDYVLFSSPSKSYQQNSGLDLNKDGRVTVAEAAALARARLGNNYAPANTSTRNTASGSMAASATFATRINMPLPVSGTGYYSYTAESRRYGLPQTIQALQAIAAAWQQAHPSGPRLGIGDISLQGGGAMSPHKSHQQGIDADIRPVSNNGKEEPVQINNANYSRQLTQQLVNLIRANKVMPATSILFNDRQVTGVSPWTGHDNHLHIRFAFA